MGVAGSRLFDLDQANGRATEKRLASNRVGPAVDLRQFRSNALGVQSPHEPMGAPKLETMQGRRLEIMRIAFGRTHLPSRHRSGG
jgi:hypothetical protein